MEVEPDRGRGRDRERGEGRDGMDVREMRV